jgi:glycerol-3-phosphate acyltransferase PlsX
MRTIRDMLEQTPSVAAGVSVGLDASVAQK